MDRRLSDRLCKLCEAVPVCEHLADVGCDHGYVSIELVRTGKVQHVLALDVNEGPLERARENVLAAGLGNRIELRLSDGLHNTEADRHFDTVLIAGMGGRLMKDILTEGIEKVRDATWLVLQPQSEIFLVREFLSSEGYGILREVCMEDRGKFYFIILAANRRSDTDETSPEQTAAEDMMVPTGSIQDALAMQDPFFFEYSGYLLQSRDSEYRKYLEKELRAAEGYLLKAGDKGERLSAEIKDIKRALSWFT